MAQKPLQHLYLALALLLTAGITASCADDLTDGSTTGTPIAFDAPRATETRAAVEGTNLPEKSSFKVWGGRTDYNTLEFDGETVTESGGAWNYTGGTRYWHEGSIYNFYALYPDDVQGAAYSNSTITINNFDCSATGDAAVDLMTASRTNITYLQDGEVPDPVGFTFEHLLARVTVSVRTGQGVTATVTSATLSGIRQTGDYNGSNWTPTEQTDSYTGSYTGDIESNNTVSLFDDLLIIPQDLSSAKLSITLTREMGNQSEDLEANFNFSNYLAQWNAGHHYRYTLTVEPDAITFSNFTVDEWGETHTGGDINIDNSGEVIPTTAN